MMVLKKFDVLEELGVGFHDFLELWCAITVDFAQLRQNGVKITRTLHPFVVPTQLEAEQAAPVNLPEIFIGQFVRRFIRVHHR